MEWKAIERGLRAEVEQALLVAGFQALVTGTPLARFAGPSALLDFLHGCAGSEDERNVVIGSLVRIARTGGPAAQLARALLWLAMWPGLTLLLRQVTRWGLEDERELVGALCIHFSNAIEALDLARCTRFAATLLRNTRKAVVGESRHRSDERAAEALYEGERSPRASAPQANEAQQILESLRQRCPEDAALVVACVVEGTTTREFAARCGQEREAVKKRLHRVLLRLRAAMNAKNAESAVPDRARNGHLAGEGSEVEEANDGRAETRRSRRGPKPRGHEVRKRPLLRLVPNELAPR